MAHLESSMGRILKIRGIANSKTMIMADSSAAQGLDLVNWQEQLAKVGFNSAVSNMPNCYPTRSTAL